MLHIVAHFLVKPARRGVFVTALAENITQTRAEGGCLRFEAFADCTNAHAFWLVEAWQSEAALTWHCEQAYARRILDRIDDWLVEPPHIVRCAPFASHVDG